MTNTRVQPKGKGDGAKVPAIDPITVEETVISNPYTFSSQKAKDTALDAAVKAAESEEDWNKVRQIKSAAVIDPKMVVLQENYNLIRMLAAVVCGTLEDVALVHMVVGDDIREKAAEMAKVILGGGTIVARKAGKAPSDGTRAEKVVPPRDFMKLVDVKMTHPLVTGNVTFNGTNWRHGGKDYSSLTKLVISLKADKPGEGTINPFDKLAYAEGVNKGKLVDKVNGWK